MQRFLKAGAAPSVSIDEFRGLLNGLYDKMPTLKGRCTGGTQAKAP